MKIFPKLILNFLITLALASCGLSTPAPLPTETQIAATPTTNGPTSTPAPALGSEELPIHILFVPSVNEAQIAAGAEKLAAKLKSSTGLVFTIAIPTSYAATIEAICKSPRDTIAFLPSLGYVLANEKCGVKVGGKAERFGLDWYAAMIVVQRGSPYKTIADLDGKKWAYVDKASTSTYLYPQYMFQQAGIKPGDSFATGSHDAAMRAVYNGDADFATAFWSPPNMDGSPVTDAMDVTIDSLKNPDVPDDLLASCANTTNNDTVLCGNFEPRDARRSLRKEVVDAFSKLRILAVTPALPNDTISFSSDFDKDVMNQIMQTLFDFAKDDSSGFQSAMEAYSWTGIKSATDTDYKEVHNAVKASGITIEDLK